MSGNSFVIHCAAVLHIQVCFTAESHGVAFICVSLKADPDFSTRSKINLSADPLF